MAEYLEVAEWDKYQHYKDRAPPWIKLHVGVLDHYEFSCLQDASKLHLMLIWVLASKLNNRIPNDAAWIKSRIGIKSDPNLKELIKNGFLLVVQDASKPLADCLRDACLETEAETEKNILKGAVKISLESLSVDHVADWLSQKRTQGKYLTVDEHAMLERFKDYCRSKNPKYKDYVAAFRNSFTWNNAPKKGNNHENPSRKPTKSERWEAAADRGISEILASVESPAPHGTD